MKIYTPIAASFALVSSFCFASPDLILSHGNVISMTGVADRAQSIAIKDGNIIAVGSNIEMLQLKGENTVVRNLEGKTVVPGFIDSHGHFAQYIPLIESQFLYPAPMGNVNSLTDIGTAMKPYFDSQDPNQNILHVAFGYDDAELEENRHPTKEELDAISQGYAFCATHISGHLATCNTKGLAFIGYDNTTPDPAGGVIRRSEDGEMTGVLEESAVYAILNSLPETTKQDAIRKFTKVQDLFASYGITTAQEGLATLPAISAMKSMAEQNLLKIDLLAYAKWVDLEEASSLIPMKTSINGFTLAGIKLVGDGSPQGKTAYLSTPYYVPPHSHAYDYHGYPVLSQEEMNQWVETAYKMDAQILSHSNGDASADLLLNAVESTRFNLRFERSQNSGYSCPNHAT